MARVVLFGATGYTGRLTARALHARGIDFAIAGRNRSRLEALAGETGDPEIHVSGVDDVGALTRAVEGSRVLISCVGPFVDLGDAAVEAALGAGVHYIDSTDEGDFIARLLARFDDRARAAGITLAPAFGFDEVPADVAATLAAQDLRDPEVDLTYAVPTTFSAGTARSALRILPREGQWIEGGRALRIRMGRRSRWVPMPPPLGPKLAVSAPLAIGYLAPLHLETRALRVYVTVSPARRMAASVLLPLVRMAMAVRPLRGAADLLVARLPEGPDDRGRGAPWTILAEARGDNGWRNISLTGRDVYGLTAECLTTAAAVMAAEDYECAGVLSPVQALGVEALRKELLDQGVEIKEFSAH